MSQNSRILAHLKRGRAITALQALKLFNCFRLAARVLDLKAAGHDIVTTPVHRGQKRFASYSLKLKGAKK